MAVLADGELARSGLVVLGPTTVAVGDSVVSVGRGGVLLLRALDGGRVPVGSVKWRLWGDPGVPGGRLRQAAVRVNAKLAAAGWNWRVRLDAGDVLLMPEPPTA
jgi:hypothetical protein